MVAWMEGAYKYVTEIGGLDTATSYPPSECGEDRPCQCNSSAASSHSGPEFVGYEELQSGDENALQSAIANQVDDEVY